MGVRERLARFGYRVPQVLLVASPGHTATRLAVERELRRSGGRLCASPAAADTLVVCGAPTGTLRAAVDRAWAQMPAPRTRMELVDAGSVADRLARATAELRDIAGAAVPAPPEAPEAPPTGGHGGDHQTMPAGLPMADVAPDRDGLTLDALHVQLGPVLSLWPAGLALHLTVQGDVVQRAEYETYGLDPGTDRSVRPFWAGEGDTAPLIAASALDSAGRLLAVAGAGGFAGQAARLRDELLEARGPGAPLLGAVEQLGRRVARSRILRWSLRGVGVLRPDDALARRLSGAPVRAGGDAYDRLMQWLLDAAGVLAGAGAAGERGEGAARPSAAAVLDVLRELVVGTDLAATRLIVASLDPDLDELVGGAIGGLRG